MSETEKKRPGPKPQYERQKPYELGAPRLATRVSPEVLEWIQKPGGQKRPEGTRPYIERIVLEDKVRTLAEEPAADE